VGKTHKDATDLELVSNYKFIWELASFCFYLMLQDYIILSITFLLIKNDFLLSLVISDIYVSCGEPGHQGLRFRPSISAYIYFLNLFLNLIDGIGNISLEALT
jgi:hypothetical protein